jgi:hypothetical protein
MARSLDDSPDSSTPQTSGDTEPTKLTKRMTIAL